MKALVYIDWVNHPATGIVARFSIEHKPWLLESTLNDAMNQKSFKEDKNSEKPEPLTTAIHDESAHIHQHDTSCFDSMFAGLFNSGEFCPLSCTTRRSGNHSRMP